MKIPHPIPYQGSKRNLANIILRFFPMQFDRLIEPFAGSAAISIASAYQQKTTKFIINDINVSLIALWKEIVETPEQISNSYRTLWQQQFENPQFYYEVRQQFNQNQTPSYLLFLLARCVKAAVRYNAEGQFNQSPDKRRQGRHPDKMQQDIFEIATLLKNKVTFYSKDYTKMLDIATTKDLIYLDPPYQGTGINGGFKYLQHVEYEEFLEALVQLNTRHIPFILSYDGRTGNKTYGKALPSTLNLTKVEIDAGRSSIATLHHRNQHTFEALYLSETLCAMTGKNFQLAIAQQQSLFNFL